MKTQWRMVLKMWRDSPQGKISVTMPNRYFSCLLKKTIEGIAPKLESNIKKGFESTGIFPVDRHRVLNKLPKYTDSSQESLHKLVGEEFQTYLNSIRSEDLIPTQRGKKYQMPVVPGKSVSLEEVQKYEKEREKSKRKKDVSDENLHTNEQETGAEKLAAGKRKKTLTKEDKKMKTKNKKEGEETETLNNDIALSINNVEIDEAIDLQIEAGNNFDLSFNGLISEADLVLGDTMIEDKKSDNRPSGRTITGFKDSEPGSNFKIKVNAMSLNGKNWRWPAKKDEIFYGEEDVIRKIDHSLVLPVNSRGDFTIIDAFLNDKWNIQDDNE
ncbi:hypothetical protein J6590_084017 [Homalodisca vitripennis]|nr:hypothetical protein J6590_084017 [Homalodisca vitripennis]